MNEVRLVPVLWRLSVELIRSSHRVDPSLKTQRNTPDTPDNMTSLPLPRVAPRTNYLGCGPKTLLRSLS